MQNLVSEHILTMSSREIADLTDKLHKNVKRDIEKMLIDLNVDALSFEHIYSDSMNRQQTEYLLDRDHTICLLTGYSAVHRMRVIQRWQELEQQAITTEHAIPQTYPEALRLAAEFAEETQRLTLVTQEQQAEIKDLKNLFKDGMTPTQFCKMLNGVNTQQVNHWLADRNWLYNETKSGTRWRSTSYARDRYLTEHQSKISVHGGEDFIKYQPVLLQKGAERIYTLYRKGSLPMKVNWDGNYTHQKEISLAS
ncbi:putative phage regulatory protein [Serratia symbiotica str. Tucson]|uniref:Phage regulatory protein n=2 Tax=Serratia symbiotica TaxID=138074 RepID=A0A455VNG3_9GAMM|nr:Rha family transcriptional regulator [Serratia symbiotica]EFW12620.1 putative phage regulatory protein [Serratia symbiotica str. Tucson]BBI91637.1 phage regulatory protein [Serratia symbiotica]BBI92198.1 phage regulatory protein [Serratia symbiotica]